MGSCAALVFGHMPDYVGIPETWMQTSKWKCLSNKQAKKSIVFIIGGRIDEKKQFALSL
jgi:hypothetical protein